MIIMLFESSVILMISWLFILIAAGMELKSLSNVVSPVTFLFCQFSPSCILKLCYLYLYIYNCVFSPNELTTCHFEILLIADNIFYIEAYSVWLYNNYSTFLFYCFDGVFFPFFHFYYLSMIIFKILLTKNKELCILIFQPTYNVCLLIGMFLFNLI